jgi:hypothetical protein
MSELVKGWIIKRVGGIEEVELHPTDHPEVFTYNNEQYIGGVDLFPTASRALHKIIVNIWMNQLGRRGL